MYNLEVVPDTDLGYVVMRVNVTFNDYKNVQLVVDGISFGYVHNAVVLSKNNVGDMDYIDLKTLEKRYMCKVQRQEDIFGAKWVEIMVDPTEIKQVEFID